MVSDAPRWVAAEEESRSAVPSVHPAREREHVLKLNMARRHMQPHEWGAAFDKLVEIREVRLGSGRVKGGTEKAATVASLCGELGTSERTARDRRKLADTYADLPEEERALVDAGYSGPSPRWSVKASTRRVPGVRFQ